MVAPGRTNVFFALAAAILVAGLAYQVAVRPSAAAPEPAPPATVVTPGDRLSVLRLERVSPVNRRRENRQTVVLDSIFTEACTVAVFFASTCPVCETIAPNWARLTRIEHSGRNFPVVWIAVDRHDRGASQFVRDNQLPTPWYAFLDRKDRNAWAVDRWPLIYFVAKGAVYWGTVGRNPAALGPIPSACIT